MFLIYICVALLLYVVGKWSVKRMEINRKLANMKGPKGLPIVGIAMDLLEPTEVLNKVLGYMREYGEIFKGHIGPTTFIFLMEPEILEIVMTSSKFIEKSNNYEFLKSWLGNGLITAPGNIWSRHRKLITPTFHFKILEKMIELFGEPTKILIKKLQEELDSGSVETDIYPLITLCSLDGICESTMGISVNAQEKSNSRFVKETKQNLQIIATRVTSAFKQTEFMFRLSFDYQRQKQTNKYLHKVTNSVIEKRRRELEISKKDEEDNKEDEFGRKKKKAFLDLLLEVEVDGQMLSNEEIRQEVDTIMFAGHDTTASATSFTLHQISRHREIQGKIYEEIQSIFGDDKTSNPTLADLNKMQYLEMVIKESLRLFPPVSYIGRKVLEDTHYKGMVIPQGTTIGIMIYCLHRNPKYYPEPEKFDPERFTPEEQSKRHPFAYIPFSAGQRNCIGQRLAMFSMKSMISRVLRNFELLPVPGRTLQVTSQVIFKSNNGMYLRLKKRN